MNRRTQERKAADVLRRALLHAVRLAALPGAVAVLFAAIVSLQAQAQTRDIILFADESLKTAIEEANALFLYENAMKVVVTYDSSAGLARQLENGAMADVFISAGPAPMDGLAGRNLIQLDTRLDLVRKPPVVYPVAVMANSTNVLASIYVQYLVSHKAAPYFEGHGFVFLPY
jgi:ABC-type molybdate transport system substrate-binding protein